ncbi:diguanylate cyclase [Halomonas stenophila]|uniref:diguanylate cyclase n=1 Tax=Halomonas stenophila TaxID=795312 RepID=A0A7W5HMP1_9GAMM|nr:diguanylate cyclase [Halomonas stenophila]MBB3232809.1 diguanylate cyclase (GGDEF)-like protein [Halomonas stenophila]
MVVNSEQQSVLVVDDSQDIHALVGARLKSERVNLLHAYDAEEGLNIARENLPDLILLDLDMPGTDGLTLCRLLKNQDELVHIPVIFLTATLDVDTKVKAFELGAVDYVTKPFDAIELKARVRAALKTKGYHDLLTTKARIDALSGLWNRGYLSEQLSAELSLWHRHGQPVSLLMMDIDHFKAINDTHGHPFGDLVIQRIGRVINRLSRESDVACRYGGEEFAMILRDTPAPGATVIAKRLRREIAALEFTAGRETVSPTMSIGVAGSDQFDEVAELSGQQLVEAADQALYRAKDTGRNRVVCR